MPLFPGHTPSMTSVIEEPRRSTSITSEYHDYCFNLVISNYHPCQCVYSIVFTIFCLPDVSYLHEHDPLADATYIRANFMYIPHNAKELSIKSGDVFHIHDEVMVM